MNPLIVVDDFLNSLTMYRLVLYGLTILVGVGVLLGLLGTLTLSWLGIIENAIVLSVVCFTLNQGLARLRGAIPNYESSLITMLILTCILPPQTSLRGLLLVGLAGAVAMVSKYLIVFRRKHVFNPTALAAVVIGFTAVPTVWWIGSSAMLPFTLILGVLVVRKLRRFTMVLTFVAAALVVMELVGLAHGGAFLEILKQAFVSWPLIFFGTIMFTEPSTTPPQTWAQLVYGVLVGGLFASELHLGRISTAPEVCLVIGNLFAAVVSPFYQLKLKLKAKRKMSELVYEYVFTPDRSARFLPGQYMEWTLPLGLLIDGRGNRRTFTIASSPTESEIHLGVKFYQPASSFKRALQVMKPGDELMAGHVGGNFTLPTDAGVKLAWVAGGIGITPFRSMLKYIIDSGQQRDIVLFYLVSNPAEISFREVLDEAQQHGVKVVPIAAEAKPADSWRGRTGSLTPEVVKQEAGDFKERQFYVSGPPGMVRRARGVLRGLGLARSQIKTDYFAGY